MADQDLYELRRMPPLSARRLPPSSEPSRRHIHTVVRTPNGNDYGVDLLRQHDEQSAHHR